MKRTLQRIAPVRAATITAVLYAFIALLFVPFFLIGMLLGDESSAAFGVGFSVAFPLFYALVGFIGTLIMCGLYNFIVPYTGGIEVEIAGGESGEQYL